MGSGLALEIHHGVAGLWEYGDWCFFRGAMHFLACLGLSCGWKSPCEINIREVNHLHPSISWQKVSALWNLAVPIGFWADIPLLNRSFKYKDSPFFFTLQFLNDGLKPRALCVPHFWEMRLFHDSLKSLAKHCRFTELQHTDCSGVWTHFSPLIHTYLSNRALENISLKPSHQWPFLLIGLHSVFALALH